ncbi:hypothetical protein ADUPG1_006895, partial [Aduncisulcus paluster]
SSFDCSDVQIFKEIEVSGVTDTPYFTITLDTINTNTGDNITIAGTYLLVATVSQAEECTDSCMSYETHLPVEMRLSASIHSGPCDSFQITPLNSTTGLPKDEPHHHTDLSDIVIVPFSVIQMRVRCVDSYLNVAKEVSFDDETEANMDCRILGLEEEDKILSTFTTYDGGFSGTWNIMPAVLDDYIDIMDQLASSDILTLNGIVPVASTSITFPSENDVTLVTQTKDTSIFDSNTPLVKASGYFSPVPFDEVIASMKSLSESIFGWVYSGDDSFLESTYSSEIFSTSFAQGIQSQSNSSETGTIKISVPSKIGDSSFGFHLFKTPDSLGTPITDSAYSSVYVYNFADTDEVFEILEEVTLTIVGFTSYESVIIVKNKSSSTSNTLVYEFKGKPVWWVYVLAILLILSVMASVAYCVLWCVTGSRLKEFEHDLSLPFCACSIVWTLGKAIIERHKRRERRRNRSHSLYDNQEMVELDYGDDEEEEEHKKTFIVKRRRKKKVATVKPDASGIEMVEQRLDIPDDDAQIQSSGIVGGDTSVQSPSSDIASPSRKASLKKGKKKTKGKTPSAKTSPTIPTGDDMGPSVVLPSIEEDGADGNSVSLPIPSPSLPKKRPKKKKKQKGKDVEMTQSDLEAGIDLPAVKTPKKIKKKKLKKI